MSDYVKSVNFAVKDTLVSGDPLKKVKGVEIDTEFNSIQTAVATKSDKASPAFTGSPTAPTPAVGESSTVIPTTKWVRDLLNVYEPLGTIKAFAGIPSTIPAGWAMCDGNNGTQNLRDRFIAGFATGGVYTQNGVAGYTPGATAVPVGGTAATAGSHSHTGTTAGHTLVEAEIPSHTHSYTSYSENNSVGTNPATTGGGTPNGAATVVGATGGGAPHAHGISTDAGHQHSVSGTAQVPGFFALMFIQKIALL